MTHLEIFHGLVAAGMNMRYGRELDKETTLRLLWEKKQIMDAGFVDYYILAFTIFNLHRPEDTDIVAYGMCNSSIVCYCLGLTEVDPVKYGLQSVRFVNEKPPKFQFDVASSRYDEFMKNAEEILQAHAEDYNIQAIRECLFQQVLPFSCLDRKREREVPDNIDDEVARYALKVPHTMDLYDTYVRRSNGEAWQATGFAALDEILAPTFGLLVYQEQMLDILRQLFHMRSLDANRLRVTIHRKFTCGETESLEAAKKDLFSDLKGLTPEEAETAWNALLSNSHPYLKAHAVSRVLASYHYEMQ